MRITPVESGEVHLVDFGEPVGHEQGYRRPAVVVSPARYNSMPSDLVVAVPLTTTNRGLIHQVPIDHVRAGLNKPSYARCEDIRSVSQLRLTRFLGKVTADDLYEIRETMRILLDM